MCPAQPCPAGTPADDGRTVLDDRDIARALTRISHEILERNRGARDLVLLGIPTRGVPLATRIAERIAAVEGYDVPVGSLDVTMYRDDLRLKPARTLLPTEIPPGGIDGKVVVLVDDVLFSGRTIRSALDALNDVGRPSAVRLAVLVDRGHRELPIRADFVGKNLPTSLVERVKVSVADMDGVDAVTIEGLGEVKRHLLSAADLTREDAELVLTTADEMRSLADRPIKKLPALRGRTVVNLFFEDSTRTRISFEAAAKRLSADVINFSAKGSSLSKGESLKDTALTLEAMGADAVVVRHGSSGAPHRLAHSGWVRSSVVNAGDGTHEHPTQALLDAFTMWKHLGESKPGGLEGRRVAIVGDVLHSRVARSNALLLRTLGAEVTLVAPPTLLPVGVETLAGRDVVRPRRGDPQGGRRDDAAGPARADGRGVLPDRPRVQPPLRPRRPADGHAPGPHDRHAPRPDGPRHGDHRRRGRLGPLGDRRAGHQRRRRPDGRALPAARRLRAGRRRRRVTSYLIKGASVLGGSADRPAARGRRRSPRSAPV